MLMIKIHTAISESPIGHDLHGYTVLFRTTCLLKEGFDVLEVFGEEVKVFALLLDVDHKMFLGPR